jgi:1,4-alpha-glucan branching enzyme
MMDRMDYLANLGINAIELMPIQAFPGRSSWGYNPVFYFSSLMCMVPRMI